MAQKEGFAPHGGSGGDGSDSPQGCHSLPSRSNPFLVRFLQKKKPRMISGLLMAQKEGFEPSRRFTQPTPLAGEPLRPLGYFCKTGS